MIKRGVYGVEWTTSQRRDEGNSHLLAWVVALVSVAALVSLSISLYRRFTAPSEEPHVSELEVSSAPAPTIPSAAVTPEPAPAPKPAAELPPDPQALTPEETRSAFSRRPPVVRNLLLRLEEAEKRRDVEMAISTIEQLRALPGAPAADLDDPLARRLGTLNVRRLFTLRSPQWVVQVAVKRGDSASRIAVEHGSTFASLQKLNAGKLEKVLIGQKLFVLNHPRFNLVVHRRLRTADLQLNGKFFKRYDLTSAGKLGEGAYVWREVTLDLLPVDRAELEMLLPKTTSVLVSEL